LTTTSKKLRALSPRYNKKRWRHFLSQDNDGILYIEGVSVRTLQKKYGTPIYVFVEEDIRQRLRTFKNAFDYQKFRPQYACKCNSNLEVLRIVREEGFEFDASSIGEIILGLLADFEPEQITFTNLYKTEQDIYFASEVGVKAITMDSMEEVDKTIALAEKGQKKIPIMLRVNPMIQNGKYNTTTQKYGIPYKYMIKAINKVLKSEHILLKGFHFHGSNSGNPKNHILALSKIMNLVRYVHKKGVTIELLDLGGGFPSEAPKYNSGKYFDADEFAPKFLKFFNKIFEKYGIEKPTLIFEPGKSMVATAGIGIMKIVGIKDLGKKYSVITDASTYSVFPDILIAKCSYEILPATKMHQRRTQKYEVVGSTCDCLDVIEDNEKLPWLEENDLLSVMDCGAYSYVMSSNFNNLKRPSIILVSGDGTTKLIRRRDRYSDLFGPELDVLKIADPYELKKYYDLTRVNIEKLWAGNENDSSGGNGNGNGNGNGSVSKEPKVKK
jgi:diaminopimelate decarboxylase